MLSTIEATLADYAAGRLVIIVDDEDRENEGDLACAAVHVTPQIIAFMAREGRGLICLSMDEVIADRLDLPPMVSDNRSPYGTNFTVSIEAATGVTTGISAADRCRTIRVAVDPASRPTRSFARWTPSSTRSGRLPPRTPSSTAPGST